MFSGRSPRRPSWPPWRKRRPSDLVDSRRIRRVPRPARLSLRVASPPSRGLSPAAHRFARIGDRPCPERGDEHRALRSVDPRDRVSARRGDRGGRPLERRHRGDRGAPHALRRDGRSVAPGAGRGAAGRADLVSVVARQEMVMFWERLVQPHVLVALASRVGELRRVNRTRVTWDAIASGAYILTTRRAYDAVGTHQSVKASVAEDVALAQAYVRHHLDIFLTHAAQFMSVRMYSSLAEIVEGWTKNLALGVPLMFPPLPLVRRAAPYLMWLPALCWELPPLFWAVYGSTWAAVTTLVSLLIWIVVYRAEEVPVRYTLLYPLGAVMVAYIMIRSAWRGSRRVEWRGRTYTPHA